MALVIRPVSADDWPSIEQLFGPSGACYGCWCTLFLLDPKQRQAMTSDERKEVFRKDIQSGAQPGLIAFHEDQPVGWLRVGRRSSVPRWNTSRTCSRPLDNEEMTDPGAWAISCFFVNSKSRGTGLSHSLVAAAIDHARKMGATHLDAAPIRQAKHSKSVGMFVGPYSAFENAGFTVVAERKAGRPLMRFIIE